MPLSDPALDPFVRLADNLGELEIVIGEKARPAVAEVRAGLREAVSYREKGDMPAAITAIRRAMERLAALGGELDPAEGEMMRAIAHRFTEALNFGNKGAAKEAVNVIRRKAGDGKDEDGTDW
ncbi:MAG TPA: hypothetical protein VIX12_03910 [Candidatus Binataceae bacterium]